MKMHGIKVMLWLLNLVLVGGIGVTGWMFVSADPSAAVSSRDKVVDDLDVIENDADRRHAKEEETSRRESDMASLWGANLRDNAPEPPPKPIVDKKPTTTVTKAPKSPLETQLAVVGIIHKVVMLDIKKPVGKTPAGQADFLFGEVIPGMRPETKPLRYENEPFPGNVVFLYGGKEVSVPMQQKLDVKSSPSTGPISKTNSKSKFSKDGKGNLSRQKKKGHVPGGARNPRGKSTIDDLLASQKGASYTEAKEISENKWQIPRSEMEMVREKGQDLLNDVDIEDYRFGQGKTGIRINHLEGNSFIAGRGFAKGDVIIEVNGHKVSSQSDLVNFVSANEKRLQNSVVVKILRQGQEKTINYSIK